MPKVLTEDAIGQYHREGYCFPVRILDDEQVAANRRRLEEFESRQGKPVEGAQRSKSHLLFKWVDDLMRDSTLLDAVEDLIGPDILCWNTIFWIKEAGSQSFVSWHQDLRYWGLDTNDLVSVWLALSPATLESGCMRVLPDSHKGDLLPHNDEYQQDNLLTRGQEIAVKVDETKTVAMPLEPGEISLHNVRLAHASGPNCSNDRRIGISLHYMPTHTKQTVGEWDTAALVRGEDRFGHFTITPRPAKDFDPSAVLFHEKATDATRKILYKDAQEDRHTI
jgi:non-heme Fe2+,alpha-ketoglutarate-dependent halogenase